MTSRLTWLDFAGTFVNHTRLSPPGVESSPHAVKDGDLIQLGVDYQVSNLSDVFLSCSDLHRLLRVVARKSIAAFG